MGSKKKIVKKKLQKKLQKDKAKKDKMKDKIKEIHDKMKKAVNGDMSKFEYQQNLLDPRFRAAMIGLNGFPYQQSGTANANQYLQEHREKNNELTRRLGFEQDMARLNQETKNLKRQLKEQADNFKRDTMILQQKQMIDELMKKKDEQKQTFEENQEFQKKKDDLQNDISNLQKTEQKQNRRRQERHIINDMVEKKEKIEHETKIAKDAEKHEKELDAAKDKFNKIKRNMDRAKQKSKYLDQLNELESEIDKFNVEYEQQKDIDMLKLKIAELKKQAAKNIEENKLKQERLDLETQEIKLKTTATPEEKDKHYRDLQPILQENAKIEENVNLVKDFKEADVKNQKLRKEAAEIGAQYVGVLPDISDAEFAQKVMNETLKTNQENEIIQQNISHLQQYVNAKSRNRDFQIHQQGLENVLGSEEANRKEFYRLQNAEQSLIKEVNQLKRNLEEEKVQQQMHEDQMRDLTRVSNERQQNLDYLQKRHKQVLRFFGVATKNMSQVDKINLFAAAGGISEKGADELWQDTNNALEEYQTAMKTARDFNGWGKLDNQSVYGDATRPNGQEVIKWNDSKDSKPMDDESMNDDPDMRYWVDDRPSAEKKKMTFP